MLEKLGFVLYPVDWLFAESIRVLSIGAKGLYVELLMQAHLHEPFGKLRNRVGVLREDILPAHCGCTREEFDCLLQELLAYGLVRRDSDGILSTDELPLFRTRVPIPDDVRQAVLDRDRGRCRYCGCVPTRATMDHIIPWSRNGSDHSDNLVTACMSCNAKKGDRTPQEAGMTLLPIPQQGTQDESR